MLGLSGLPGDGTFSGEHSVFRVARKLSTMALSSQLPRRLIEAEAPLWASSAAIAPLAYWPAAVGVVSLHRLLPGVGHQAGIERLARLPADQATGLW